MLLPDDFYLCQREARLSGRHDYERNAKQRDHRHITSAACPRYDVRITAREMCRSQYEVSPPAVIFHTHRDERFLLRNLDVIGKLFSATHLSLEACDSRTSHCNLRSD